jgi:hypothetical protein
VTGVLIAMTLPGVALLLMVLGIVEQVATRARRRASGLPGRGSLAGGGIDVLQAALYPEKRHQIEEQRSQTMRRDDVDDGAPPHSSVDLVRGVARLRVGAPDAGPRVVGHGDCTLR